MNKIIKMLWITVTLIGISSAAVARPNQDFGTVVGGIAGGLIGNNLGHGCNRAAATIGGAVVGSLVGNQLGYSADRQYYRYPPPCRYNRYYNTRWVGRPYPYRYRYYYPPAYRGAFIGRGGRVYRRTVVTNTYGNRVVTTYRSNHTAPNRYYIHRARVY